MSTFPSNAFMTTIFGDITAGTPYLALYTSNPTAADTGTEVSGGLYARQAITFGAPSGSSMSNNATITFTGVPGGTITHWGIRTASTGGTLRVYGALTSNVVSETGDNVIFSPGDIVINLGGS